MSVMPVVVCVNVRSLLTPADVEKSFVSLVALLVVLLPDEPLELLDELLLDEPQLLFPVTVSVCAFVLSPSAKTTFFVPVKHVECVIVHESDAVVPAEIVVPELDVGSPDADKEES